MSTLDLEANKRILEANKRIAELEADVQHYKSLADLLQEAVQDLEDELRAAKGQMALMRQDYRYTA
jgi:uncharacterized coiled-coil DUF342 family protein